MQRLVVRIGAHNQHGVLSATLARFYGVGNCGEMADLAFTEATHWAALLGFSVESLVGENYDHAWTVFNRDPTTDINRPADWNDDAVICDNWLGKALDPKNRITDVNQPKNPHLSHLQRLHLIDQASYLHEVMPGANIFRADTTLPHATQIQATSQQVFGLLPQGTQAENINLWDSNPTAECAAATDREVNAYLQQVPEAQPWLQVFHSYTVPVQA